MLSLSGKAVRFERNRPPFNLRVILIFGSPVWMGAVVAGWFLAGMLGAKSVLIGLALLGVYIVISMLFAKKFDELRTKSAGLAMSVVVAGFFVRVMALWVATFIIHRLMEINLAALALTVGFGFTVIMFITVVNSSLELR
jgi:hypothetical protein